MDSRFGGEDADTAESVTAVMNSKLYYYYLPGGVVERCAPLLLRRNALLSFLLWLFFCFAPLCTFSGWAFAAGPVHV